MTNLKSLLGFLIGIGVFIYLVGSFLIASFDIALWQDGHRFFAMVIYLMIVWPVVRAFIEPAKLPQSKRKDVLKEMDAEQLDPATVGNG